MNTIRFTNLPGDGIGPEVMKISLNVLEALGKKKNFQIETSTHDVGGVGIDNHGSALPHSTLSACSEADAILFGSVGGPKWENLPPKEQPERAALLPIRKEFELFANLRPGNLYPELSDLSPLRSETVSNGIDVLCVRKCGITLVSLNPRKNQKMRRRNSPRYDDCKTSEIEESQKLPFEQLYETENLPVDKANVHQTSVLWRKVLRNA